VAKGCRKDKGRRTIVIYLVNGSVSVINGNIVFGCFNGKLYFVDRDAGKIDATFQTEESIKRYSTIYGDNDQFKKKL
jgi:eukaryotic-like serine/threonine-protein kinase